VGTLVTASIAVLAQFLSGEEYLIDVCLIYVMISFLSTVVFTSVFINEYIMRDKKKEKNEHD